MPSKAQHLNTTTESNDLVQYVKACEVTKMNLQSCEGAFYKLSEQRTQESFWQSTEGEITKFLIYFAVGAATVKIIDD